MTGTIPKIVIIIPAFNEAQSIVKVINDIPKDCVNTILVVNNNSSDKTSCNAAAAGAIVLDEPRQGYGYACLKGIEYLRQQNLNPDIVVFLDADYSDYPGEMCLIVKPIIEGSAELVIGSRALGNRKKGAMLPHQIFGNWLATELIAIFYKVHYSDLGPFRAITWKALQQLNMKDTTYGWTVEMQLKAAKLKLKVTEVPVSYRERIGSSKISGTVKGTVLAGYKILTTIFKYL